MNHRTVAMNGAMRVVIVGAGQMGSIYAAAAAENGHMVHLVDANGELVEHINREGLSITRREGRVDAYRIPASVDVHEGDPPADLVVIIVKGWASRAAAERVAPAVRPGTVVLTIQNGLGNEEVLRAAFPQSELLLGISVHTVVTTGVGRYNHTGVRETFIGPATIGSMDAASRVAEVFAGPAFPVVVLPEAAIRREQWAKFVLNCALLPVLGLSRLPTAVAGGEEALITLMEAVARETCEIAQAQGINLDPDERVAFQRELLRTAGGRASLLGDVLACRKTEIDSINGAAIAYADRHHLAAPLNRALFALVKGLERSFEVADS